MSPKAAADSGQFFLLLAKPVPKGVSVSALTDLSLMPWLVPSEAERSHLQLPHHTPSYLTPSKLHCLQKQKQRLRLAPTPNVARPQRGVLTNSLFMLCRHPVVWDLGQCYQLESDNLQHLLRVESWGTMGHYAPSPGLDVKT